MFDIQSKITRHTTKQESTTHNEKRNQVIELTQILELQTRILKE